MKIFYALLLLLTMGAACVNAWQGNTAMTVVLCTVFLVYYDQMRGRRDGW